MTVLVNCLVDFDHGVTRRYRTSVQLIMGVARISHAGSHLDGNVPSSNVQFARCPCSDDVHGISDELSSRNCGGRDAAVMTTGTGAGARNSRRRCRRFLSHNGAPVVALGLACTAAAIIRA